MREDIVNVYVAVLPLVFPNGFTIGGSNGKSNALEIERNGEGMPVIRGTSMAGLLREATEESDYSDEVELYFGKALDTNEDRQESLLVVHDVAMPNASESSMHNRMNRHTGSPSVANKGLFSVEKTAPGCEGELVLELRYWNAKDAEEGPEFLEFLAETLNGGALVGGNSNRGGGLCKLKGNAYYLHAYDLSNAEQSAAYLDWTYAEKKPLAEADKRSVAYGGDRFTVKVSLRIPEGQDLLCAEGSEMVPVETERADGTRHWKIPGATLRGIFRGWMSRLAARSGKKLVDSVEEHRANPHRKETEMKGNDAIRDLFGSLEQKGRIHIGDAYSAETADKSHCQSRKHVVIDRFTGGTNDGKLFEDIVLVSSGLHFSLEISILDAEQKEVDWLHQTLQALNLGLIRVGSSKASGRLEVTSLELLSNPDDLSFETELRRI